MGRRGVRSACPEGAAGPVWADVWRMAGTQWPTPGVYCIFCACEFIIISYGWAHLGMPSRRTCNRKAAHSFQKWIVCFNHWGRVTGREDLVMDVIGYKLPLSSPPPP